MSQNRSLAILSPLWIHEEWFFYFSESRKGDRSEKSKSEKQLFEKVNSKSEKWKFSLFAFWKQEIRKAKSIILPTLIFGFYML